MHVFHKMFIIFQCLFLLFYIFVSVEISVFCLMLTLNPISLKIESSAGEIAEDCSDVLPEGSYMLHLGSLNELSP